MSKILCKLPRTCLASIEWSNHVHELEKRARDWARAIERTERYFPYGTRQGTRQDSPQCDDVDTLSYHGQLTATAREKIRQAIATLLDEGALPAKIGARFQVLTHRFHLGGATLYKHKDLWHPHHVGDPAPVETPPDPPLHPEAPSPDNAPSLLEQKSSKGLSSEGLESLNSGVLAGQLGNETGLEGDVQSLDMKAVITLARRRQQQVQADRQAIQAAHRRQQAAAAQQAYVERMRQYLSSDDPILVAEVLNWLRQCPEYLDALWELPVLSP